MSGAAAPLRRPAGWMQMLFATASTGLAVDVALVVMRIVLAWIFIDYGAAKLFGAFPGSGPHGLHDTATYMSQSAHLHPGELFAVLGGVTEFGGGIAMALGLCTRLAGLALFGDMVMAMVTVMWATGFNPRGAGTGYQFNLAVAGLALAVALLGSGRFSIDTLVVRAFGRPRSPDPTSA